MPSIESILSKYDPSSSPEEPQSAEPSPKAAPSSIDSILSKYESSAPTAQEKPQLHVPNPFVSTAKSTAASMANAFAGQPLEDIGETIGSETLQKAGKGVREFAEGVQKENPSQIGSLSDIVDKPLTAVETALGNVAPQIPVSLAGGYAGAKLGGSLPLPLPAKAVAAGVGGILGAFAPNYLQEAAEMRGKQQESGVEDKTKAYLTAIPAAGLETASDVLLAGKFLPKAVKDTAIGKALTGLGDDTLSATGSRAAHVGKQALKGAGTEAGTEYAQTILEQLGGNQDTSTEEAQAEREVSAALGAIGGGAVGGGVSAFDKRAGKLPSPVAEEQAATQEPDFAEVPDTQPQEPIIAGAPSDLDLRTDEEKAAERQDRFNDLSARFYGTSDTDTVFEGKQVTIPGRPKEFLAPEEKAELAELEKEFGTPIDLSTPAAPVVDTKQTEDFLNRFENAWATTGKEPTRVTKALAEEAAKLGVPVTPNDAPMAIVAAMRAEIEARKSPEEVAQDVGDSIVAETLAAYPDGKPGIAGKTVIAGAGTKVLEPQKIAAEQKIAEQQPFVEEPIDEQALQDEAAAYQAELDAIPGVSERPPLTPLTTEDLQNQRMLRDAAAAELLHPVEEEDEDSERQAALQARYEANKAAAAATETPVAQQPEIKNGESEDQTAQTTTQEVNKPEPLPPSGYTQAVKQPTGKYKLFYIGTTNEVFPGELFTSARDAKNYLEVAKARRSEAAPAPVDEIAAQTTTQEVTEAPEEVTEAPEEKARKLLVSAVPNGDLSSLRGKQNTDNRAKLLEALTGQPIAKSAATNAKLAQEFYKAAGIDLNQSLAGQQKQFQDWATQTQQLEEAGITEEFPIDLQAHKEAAASRLNGHRELPENRDAQKKAYVTVKDLNIGIENPAGTKRRPEWPELKDHYGFFTGVKGADGDYLDVFIQPKLSPEAIENIQKVFIVDQKNEDGSFDEHKILLGPDNLEAAKALYLENYDSGWQGLGAITEMGFDEFKARIESGANWGAPLAYKEPAVEEKPKAKEVKPAEGEKLTKPQMRDSIIAEIDEAIAAAPKTQSVYGQETDEIKQLQEEYKTYGTTEQRKHEITKEIQDLYSVQEDRLTFKIPGGTRFKVLNTKPSLEEFKKKVLASPGFKETTRAAPSKPKAPSFSVSNMIAEFLKDNEFDNAYYAAQEAGVRLGFGTSEKENTIPVYADLEPVDLIPGRKMFVGRRFAKIEYKGKTEVKTYWHVIDEDSGASFSSGSNKKDAIATAEKAIKERAGIDGGKRLTELLEQAEARGANQEQLLAKFKKLNGIEDEQVEESDVKFSRTETGGPLPELFESLGRVNKLSQLSDDQLQRIDEHPDAERIRYVQDNFLDLLSELDTNNKVTIKC